MAVTDAPEPVVQDDPAESAIAPVPGRWAKRLPKDEYVFLWLAIGATVVMTAFTVGWIFVSDHNVPTRTKATTPKEFGEQVAAFMAANDAQDGVVEVPPGEDAYMMAERYRFYPQLVLERGETYTIWVSARDVLHGFSIIGDGRHLNFTVAPGHAYGLRFTPDKAGDYTIVCNEYCGRAHHAMTGRITVKE